MKKNKTTQEDIEAMDFCNAFEVIARRIHDNAEKKGFWKGPFNHGEKIALIHSELSELLEAARRPKKRKSKKIPRYTEWEEEIADSFIRMMDYAVGLGYQLSPVIIAKMKYNEGREYKHGKQF